MRKYIIASHSTFAEGIYNSLKLIMGEQENVKIINAFVDGNDIVSIVSKALNEYRSDDEIIVCTDVLGGSVNNEFMKHLGERKMYLITGMNLPMLMQLFTSSETNTEKMIREIVMNPDTAPKYCNDLINGNNKEEDF